MARSKHPERTIEQILTISEKLFIERGYEKTTMQDILNELKMSKGAIYHHFKSKEEILQTIIDKKVSREKTLLHDLAARTHAENARDKISQILSEFLVNEADAFNSAPKSLMLSTIKDPNIVVASLQTSVLDMAPTLSKLFAEGVEDGSIKTDYPLEYAEIFMLLFGTWIKPTLFNRDKQQTEQRLKALKQLMALLGIDIISETMIEKVLAFYQENELV